MSDVLWFDRTSCSLRFVWRTDDARLLSVDHGTIDAPCHCPSSEEYLHRGASAKVISETVLDACAQVECHYHRANRVGTTVARNLAGLESVALKLDGIDGWLCRWDLLSRLRRVQGACGLGNSE